jgi:hypothetical protein
METYQLAASNLFQMAHSRAQRAALLARLRGRSNTLLALGDLLAGCRLIGQQTRGLRVVPLQQIVGSEGRAQDFDQGFLPRAHYLQERWCRIAQAMAQEASLPPITLYKLGDSYFVCDGNHRVSVARARGQVDIDAYVTELLLHGPLPAALAARAVQQMRPGVPWVEALATQVLGFVQRLRRAFAMT